MIERFLTNTIKKKFFKGKAIIILGPRQVGKTTLIHELTDNNENVMWFNGDELDVQALFNNISATRLKSLLGKKNILVIDEAQRIEDIGIRLKLITDTLQDVQLIASGSSSFELANHVNEPLTGRKWEYNMFPVSFAEMVAHHGLLEEKRLLPQRLLYGYYPDVINHPGEEKEILKFLSDSFLYKDILSWEQIQKPDNLIKLLQAISFQVGSQVSYNELGQLCGIDSKTVEKYITLLEKTYIIFRLGSFSRNLRNELKNSKKIYFWDNGIRNSVIANFNQIELRNDTGALWENFIVSERLKFLNYSGLWANKWFWRTKEQKEIDYIEEYDGNIYAYEFKWNDKQKFNIPKAFSLSYPDADFKLINKDNFDEFIL
ncbi:MAG: ATP-binding protein [Prolixibacteraceae bacterium]|nr:ATP-binding protein [Prolixibacteraceae bacterium]